MSRARARTKDELFRFQAMGQQGAPDDRCGGFGHTSRTRAGLLGRVQGWRVRTAGAMAGAADDVLGPDLIMMA